MLKKASCESARDTVTRTELYFEAARRDLRLSNKQKNAFNQQTPNLLQTTIFKNSIGF